MKIVLFLLSVCVILGYCSRLAPLAKIKRTQMSVLNLIATVNVGSCGSYSDTIYTYSDCSSLGANPDLSGATESTQGVYYLCSGSTLFLYTTSTPFAFFINNPSFKAGTIASGTATYASYTLGCSSKYCTKTDLQISSCSTTTPSTNGDYFIFVPGGSFDATTNDGFLCNTGSSCCPRVIDSNCAPVTPTCNPSGSQAAIAAAFSACRAQFTNCQDDGTGSVIGFVNCMGCNCDPIGQWAAYCYITGHDNYNCADCTNGQIQQAHSPCNCNAGTTPAIGSYCTGGKRSENDTTYSNSTVGYDTDAFKSSTDAKHSN